MNLDRMGRRWPGIAIGLIAFMVGVALLVSGRPGAGYAGGLALLGLVLALVSIMRALRPRPRR